MNVVASFHLETLRESPFILVVSPDHPLSNYPSITLPHLMNHVWAMSISKSHSQTVLAGWLKTMSMTKLTIKLSSFESVQFCVEAGLAIAYLPEYLLQNSLQQKKLVKLNVERLPTIKGVLVLAYRRDLQLNEAIFNLIRFLHEYC